MIDLLQPSVPELGSFATGNLSKHPNLWDSLVGCWIPNLGVTGNTLYDVSGHGNHGNLTNMDATAWIVDERGIALDYNGIDDYVDLSTNSIFDIRGAITVTAWVNINTIAGTYHRIAEKDWSSSFFLGTGSAVNSIGFSMDSNSDTANILNTPLNSISLQKWEFLAGMWDGQQLRIYINGILAGTKTWSNTVTGSSNSVKLGKYFGGTGNSLDGKIGNVSIYNRALTPQDLQQLYINSNAMLEFADRTFWRAPVVGGLLIQVAMHHYTKNIGGGG